MIINDQMLRINRQYIEHLRSKLSIYIFLTTNIKDYISKAVIIDEEKLHKELCTK